MEYESDILKRLINTYGVVGNPRYISEIIKEFIVRGKEYYPELFTYQSDWLAHIDEFGLNPSYTVSYTGQSIYAPNTLERPVKRAILKGCTGYRDIDTGEVLDNFETGRNLELVSVRMPVLTTSNEDGTKTNILTTNEEVELRGVGDVQDTLDCLTGEVVQNIGEMVLDGSENWVSQDDSNWNTDTHISFKFKINNMSMNFWNSGKTNCISDKFKTKLLNEDTYIVSEEFIGSHGAPAYGMDFDIKLLRSRLNGNETVDGFKQWLSQNPIAVQYELATESIKTVDLTILDQNGQNVKQLMSFNGGTHFNTGSLEGSPLPSVSVSVETDLEETLKVCSLEGNTM